MKAARLLGLCLLFGSTVGCRAADRDFNNVVHEIEHHYNLHATHVPMMRFVSFVARVGSHGAMKGLRVVEFEQVGDSLRGEELAPVLEGTLGESWLLFVQERSQDESEQTFVFTQPKGNNMKMLIADYSNGELDIVRMELSAKQLAKWMRDPIRHAKQAAHEGGGEETN
jgi:hypothetical protein